MESNQSLSLVSTMTGNFNDEFNDYGHHQHVHSAIATTPRKGNSHFRMISWPFGQNSGSVSGSPVALVNKGKLTCLVQKTDKSQRVTMLQKREPSHGSTTPVTFPWVL